MPSPRFGLAASTVNGKIYVLGGYGGGTTLATVEAYDPTENSWSSLPSMSTVRWLMTAAASDGKVYAIGGSAGGPPFATVEELALERTLYAHRKN